MTNPPQVPTEFKAMQIFQVLRKVGSHHTFSAGLLIGGKSLAEEQSRIENINILICTPGRLLQHMDQTASLHCETLQLLVLDEADRILDMGFRGTVDGIIQHLPRQRQTLLFSATQTSSVRDLARLSLKEPEYVAVHEGASESTPETLKGYWVECALPEKLDTLYAFIKTHLRLKTKALVFMSTTKQVTLVVPTRLTIGTVCVRDVPTFTAWGAAVTFTWKTETVVTCFNYTEIHFGE